MEPAAPEPAETGPVEIGVKAQVAELERGGWITAAHAGAVALALRAARDVDQSEGKGAPSGRANLLRSAKEILEMLPGPEIATGQDFEAALAAIQGTPS
jgi:hypothetical protein